ncbi:hypothetical protein V1L52_10105 [Treponema sp. HNW]|uniref:hypothetical protein n=1 Tax=Treponema sp. HNW TaxID=3116654 RepID=UPI003D105243
MKMNQIFSGDISPCKTLKKDYCIVWIFKRGKKPCWFKALFSGCGFHFCGIDITDKVIAWKVVSKKELQNKWQGHKALSKKEKILIEKILN